MRALLLIPLVVVAGTGAVYATASALLPASPPAAAPEFTITGPFLDQVVVAVSFPSIPGATGYRIWVDGKVTGTQVVTPSAAKPSATQGFKIPLPCNPAGINHTLNVQAMNASGGGPKRSAPRSYWTRCGPA